MLNRLQSEKARAAATAQAEAQSQARSDVSRILAAERALAQENLQEAIVRERLTTEDARRRTELLVSVPKSPESCLALWPRLFTPPQGGRRFVSSPSDRRQPGARTHPYERPFIHSPACLATDTSWSDGLRLTSPRRTQSVILLKPNETSMNPPLPHPHGPPLDNSDSLPRAAHPPHAVFFFLNFL